MMSCLQCGKEGDCDVSREERVNHCPTDDGMRPLVSIHVRCCVRGVQLVQHTDAVSLVTVSATPILSACSSRNTTDYSCDYTLPV